MTTSSKPDEPPHYLYDPDSDQNYVVLPLYLPASLPRNQRRRILFAATFLLLAVAVYFLWPSDPDLKIARLGLDRIHIQTDPIIAVDVTLKLIVKVRNLDLYSIEYQSLVVSIGYRGKKLGFVSSDHGYVRARGSSYVDATLELDGVEVFSDIILLLEDLAKGLVLFDTVTEIRGRLGFLYFEVPLKAKISCEIYVNTRNQTVISQNCYQE